MEERESKILILVIIALLIGVKIGSMNFYVENCECEVHNDIENFIYEEDNKSEKVEDYFINIVPVENGK